MLSRHLARIGLLALTSAAVVHGQSTLRSYGNFLPSNDAGYHVLGLDDYDGDGVPEHAISYKLGAGNGGFPGAVEVYSGADGSLIRRHQGGIFGVSNDARLGDGLALLGDLDGDGYRDYAVAAPSDDASGAQGSVHVHSGRTGVRLWQVRGDVSTGQVDTPNAGPDLDGDGIDEVFVRANSRNSLAYSGANGALLRTFADTTFSFGAAIVSPGDLNGDGTPDLLVAAPSGNNGSGFVRILSGATTQPLAPALLGPAGFATFGASLLALGDLNGDGIEEVAIGAPYEGAGTVRIYDVVTRTVLALLDGATFGAGSSSGTAVFFGASIAKVGDTNGDGVPDLAIGAYYDVAFNTGALYVVSMSDWSLIFRKRSTQRENYAFSVSSAGDTDGDGLAEVLVGAPFALNGANGRVDIVEWRSLGATFCSSTPSSTGATPDLAAFGSPVAADNDLTLRMTGAPNGGFGLFAASRLAMPLGIPLAGGGVLCLGGAPLRFTYTLGMIDAGTLRARLDLTAFPEPPTYQVAVMAGDVWYFQAWFRDSIGGVATSRLSTAIQVDFE
ncbi:MAG: FG-GAP-like repeat-containing protein [Planctomycetota bacterium]